MRLPRGKIPKEILEEFVFKNLGVRREEVILGPSAGIDGAVINTGDKSLIVSMDPITGALEKIGWLAVNVNANDIATFGVKPAFFLSCIMLPERSDDRIIKTVSVQMGEAAKALKIAIIGGHCETTQDLPSPIVVGCAFGFAEKGRFVTAGGAKPGDSLILTKTAGIEGTAILATDRKKQLKKALSEEALQEAADFYDQISVVKDALAVFRTGAVHAMHDPTEGGIAGGMHEMADASRLGFEVYEERIPIRFETSKICRFFRIDPLQLIASGSLLVAVESSQVESALGSLQEAEIPAQTVGKFNSNPSKRILMRKNGKAENMVRTKSDHLWKALKKGDN